MANYKRELRIKKKEKAEKAIEFVKRFKKDLEKARITLVRVVNNGLGFIYFISLLFSFSIFSFILFLVLLYFSLF